jgi:hypothetical protein
MSGEEHAETMMFAPKPENDFAHYIYTYYVQCKSRFERIEAIAGKWMFRDLVPGMSDFDTRFIVRDGMSVDHWCQMSTAVGEAHLALCESHSCWARNLEHLPGINLTWSELTSEQTYYPEYQQWSFYHSEHLAKIGAARDWFAHRPWDAKDEYFHLKKLCTFYGRYNRTIDPPINLGMHENKYPLHSRLMHYFTPAVQAAACLLDRRSITGKFDSLEIVQQRFPRLACWSMVQEILHANYELPRWYREPLISQLEDELEAALRTIVAEVRKCLTLVPQHIGADVRAWSKVLHEAPIDPSLIIVENVRFCRLMKGRLLFYAKAPAHFHTSWLIGNELGRIGASFFRAPFIAYWKITTGQSITEPEAILDNLRGDLLTSTEVAATKEFARLTPGHCERGQENQIALAIVDVFDDFFKAITKVAESVYQRETTNAKR